MAEQDILQGMLSELVSAILEGFPHLFFSRPILDPAAEVGFSRSSTRPHDFTLGHGRSHPLVVAYWIRRVVALRHSWFVPLVGIKTRVGFPYTTLRRKVMIWTMITHVPSRCGRGECKNHVSNQRTFAKIANALDSRPLLHHALR